jgi:hypothetical protein
MRMRTTLFYYYSCLTDVRRLQVAHVFCVCAVSSKFSFISDIDCDSGNDAKVVNSFMSHLSTIVQISGLMFSG